MIKNYRFKRVISLLFVVAMILSMFSATGLTSVAAEVSATTGLKDGLNIEQIGSTLAINWAAVSGAASYEIQRSGARLGTTYTSLATVASDVLSYTDIAPNTDKYENYYKVIAKNADGEAINTEIISLEGKIFGEKVYIYDAKYQTGASAVEEVSYYSQLSVTPEMSPNRYAFFFKPGDYTANSRTMVGFYSSVYGLGKLPTDVTLSGVRCQSNLGGNNTQTFWRSIENVEVTYTPGFQGQNMYGFNWCVAQAAPARRINSIGECHFNFGGGNGWSSPGYFADCVFHNGFTFSSQQNYTRNSHLAGGSYPSQNWNTFIHASTGSGLPADSGSGWSSSRRVTNLPTIEMIREKPFIYLDGGEYKVFVPSWRKDSSGVTWSATDMGPGTSIDLLDNFYIAYPDKDTAASINAALATGKNLLLTPGNYFLEKPIHVTNPDTIVLGLGYATLVPNADNQWGALLVEDFDGIIISGVLFDAHYSSLYLLRVGEEGSVGANHSANPILLQDVYFRVGGFRNENVHVDVACQINSNDVIGDHFWIWRADHGSGVGWARNTTDFGLFVSGDRVTCNALFNEHFQKYTTYWEGEDGKVFFYQNETPYDPTNQAVWMSHKGTVNGYAQYKVAKNVTRHNGIGMGVYPCLNRVGSGNAYPVNGFEVPINEGVKLDHIFVYHIGSSGNYARFVVNNHAASTGTTYLNHYSASLGAGTEPVDDPDDPDFIAPNYAARSLVQPFDAVVTPDPDDSYIAGWNLVWRDEFAGDAVDPTKWSFQNGTGSGGWGNNEMEYYRPENARVEDNMLIIKAEPQEGKTITDARNGNTYWSSKLRTYNNFSQTYGRFEAKISLPIGEGFWPAFWMMPQGAATGSENGSYGGWPTSGEIDIMEAKGRFPTNTSGALHRANTSASGNIYTATDRPLPEGQTINDFHVYAVEWDPAEMRWYVDGDLYQTVTAAQWNMPYYKNNYPNNPYAPFDKPFQMILNLAVGGNFDYPSYPGRDGGPKVGEMKVDYVRVYQRIESVPVVTSLSVAPGRIDKFEAVDVTVNVSGMNLDDADVKAGVKGYPDSFVSVVGGIATIKVAQNMLDAGQYDVVATLNGEETAVKAVLYVINPDGLPKDGDVIYLVAESNKLIVGSDDRDAAWTGQDTQTTLKAKFAEINDENREYIVYTVEYNPTLQRYYLKAGNGKYVTIEGPSWGGTVVRPRTNAKGAAATSWEALVFDPQEDGTVKIYKELDGNAKHYMNVLTNGNLQSSVGSVGDSGKFRWYKEAGTPDPNAPTITDLTVDEKIASLVAGYDATIPVTVSGTNLEEVVISVTGAELAAPASIVGEGTVVVKVKNVQANFVITATAGESMKDVSIPVVDITNDNIWVAALGAIDGKTAVTFSRLVKLGADPKPVVKINGVARNASEVSVNANIITIDKEYVAGETVVISGVRFPELFPSYSFTFTL